MPPAKPSSDDAPAAQSSSGESPPAQLSSGDAASAQATPAQPASTPSSSHLAQGVDEERVESSAAPGLELADTAASTDTAALAALALPPPPPPREPSASLGVIRYEDVPPPRAEPFCSKCGYTVDPVKRGVRLLTKSPPSFECSKCNSKQTMLSRMFGQWPLQQFRDLDQETQQAFWRSSTSNGESLKKAVEHHLVKRLVDIRCAKEEGPFLPLSAWQSRGFDIDTIRR